MLNSLRSRLLFSYFAVIGVALAITAVILFFSATTPAVRLLPALQRLATIGQSNRAELRRLQLSGADSDDLQAVLARTAAENNVRIAVAVARTGQVRFDTDQSQSWLGVNAGQVQPTTTRLIACAEQGNVGGLFQAPDGSRWLICSQLFDDFRILYAEREPTPRAFFGAFFLRPLFQAGLVAFVLATLLAVTIARSVARPLQRTAQAVAAISQGDYEQQVPVQGPEEVRQVASGFNDMVTRVKMSQQAQRDFVANVSHDLKTPITSIRGWSQALLDGTAVTPEEQTNAATIIHNEAERMSRMVNQLLDLARIESGQIVLARERVNLSQLLTDVYHSFLPRALERDINLTLAAPDVPPIWGDYDRLMQVFTNLADNALTHTDGGGRVHLEARRHNPGAVEAVVQDTGRGIPPADLARIFERFYQVDKARTGQGRGTGLGLAIVKQLVEAHNGRIQAHSEVGRGTVFIVRLPTSDVPERTTAVMKNRE